jgi:hypothetical protein
MMRLHEINFSRTLFQLLGFFNQYIRRIIEKSKEKSKSVGLYRKSGENQKRKKTNIDCWQYYYYYYRFLFQFDGYASTKSMANVRKYFRRWNIHVYLDLCTTVFVL